MTRPAASVMRFMARCLAESGPDFLADKVAQRRRSLAIAFTLRFVRNDALRRGVKSFAQRLRRGPVLQLENAEMRPFGDRRRLADLRRCDSDNFLEHAGLARVLVDFLSDGLDVLLVRRRHAWLGPPEIGDVDRSICLSIEIGGGSEQENDRQEMAGSQHPRIVADCAAVVRDIAWCFR